MRSRVVYDLVGFAAVCLAVPRMAAAQSAPTFSRDVAPILYRACVSCHQPGGAGPFPLVTYDDARSHASQIAEVTARRVMPPWNTGPEHEFVDQPRLSEAEIGTLARWAAEGRADGDPAQRPPAPRLTNGWRLGVPDLVVALPQAYALPAESGDVFRIFVIPIPGDTVRFVRGIELRPGATSVVHHVNIRIDSTPTSRERDAADPAPGYDGLLPRTARFPDGHFLGWTPGQAAPLLPKGQAWRLEPHVDLVLQMHMRPSGKPESIRPEVAFYFGSDPPDDRVTMIRLGRQNIDIAAGDREYIVTDSYVLPVDASVQAVQPHAHFRAREIRGDATQPDGTVIPLISIRRWDFRWQHVYRYVTPVALPRGTRVSMRFTYDNSDGNAANPVRPPVEAQWGQRSEEEMGDLWLQLLARTPDDRDRLDRDFRPKAAHEDLVGYEALIRRTPDDPGLRDDAAVLCLELNEPDAAAAHWRHSVALRPELPAAHFNLATALTLGGHLDAASTEFAEALRLNPHYTKAHNNLGRLLLTRGQIDAAVAQFTAALADQPRDAEAHYNLGVAYRTRQDRAAAMVELRTAATLAPDWLAPTIDLAWTLAAAPQVTAAEAADAVVFAERAVALTRRQDAAALDTLGVALAAAGQFERAGTAAGDAIALTTDQAFAAEIRGRQSLYARRRRYTP